MGLFIWVLAAGAGYAGYRGYRRLRDMEKDLRGEVAGENHPEKEAERPVAAKGPVIVESPANLETRVLQRVREQPGILQTELYVLLPGEKRRVLQELLKGMDRAGVLKRVKEGGTYKLHPGKQ